MRMAAAELIPTTRTMDNVRSADADERALETAFDRCATALYRYILVRVGGDTHRADDFMQQLWIRSRTLVGTPDEHVEFRLRAIAKNLIRTWWREARRQPACIALPDPALAAELARRLVRDEPPDAWLVRDEVRTQLLLAVTELSASDQELVFAHYFDGLSQSAIASARATTARAIEGRLYRIRALLREKLLHLEPF